MEAAGLPRPSDCIYAVPRRARIVCVPFSHNPKKPAHIRVRAKEKDFHTEVLVLALPIFTARRQATIVGVSELNFCVRDGNRWTLTTINTNSHREGFALPLY